MLGDIVTTTASEHAGLPHVVVGGPARGQVQLCYCGSERWYVPYWHPLQYVTTEVPDGPRLRRARRLLAELKPDHLGRLWIVVGRDGYCRGVQVGHVAYGALSRSAERPEVTP